jgi:hypothetical protein
MLKRIILFFSIAFFTSCDKEIQLPLDSNASLLVIDASITDEVGPYIVKISKSKDVSNTQNYPIVENAMVILFDNQGQRDTLSYTNNGIYETNFIKGIAGRTYNLEVLVDGKKYTAASTMANKVSLNNLRVNTFLVNGETRYSIIPEYLDPIQLGNSYRFIQKINDTLDQTFHVFNDNLNNGKINQRPLRGGSDSLEVKLNDNISVEMQCITRPTYLYYYTLNLQSGAGPGGGTTPANPPTNIQGGALGIFSAHTVTRKTIRVQ